MPNSFLSKNTTVNDKFTAGRFDPKVFVNCVQYAVDKDLRVETSCSKFIINSCVFAQERIWHQCRTHQCMVLRYCITYMCAVPWYCTHVGNTCYAVTMLTGYAVTMLVSLLQFVGLVMEESPLQVEMSAYVYGASDTYHAGSQHILTVIPILLFATVGLFLVLYIHHSWGLVGTVLAQTQVARHTMRSTMLILWAVFVWMMVQFYTANKAMSDTIQEERLLTLFKDVYTPQVTAGYVQWGSFLAILFLEAPVLCVFFFRKATDLHNRRQQFSKTNCRLCYWLTVLCDTLGSIGVVTAVQIASVYLLYSALYLTVSPTIAITCVSNVLAIVASLLMCTTMLMQMVSSCCKIRSFGRIIKGLAFLLLGLLCIAISGYLIMQVKNDKQSSHDTIRGLLRSVVSSVIIGIYGYTVKRLLFQRKEEEGAERENRELEPLINKG